MRPSSAKKQAREEQRNMPHGGLWEQRWRASSRKPWIETRLGGEETDIMNIDQSPNIRL